MALKTNYFLQSYELNNQKMIKKCVERGRTGVERGRTGVERGRTGSNESYYYITYITGCVL